MTFAEKLRLTAEKNDSLVCVGLDTDITRLPAHLRPEENPVLRFNDDIISATSDLVSAYKPNSAFYESMGSKGVETLVRTREAIPSHIPVILDVKRGDIGNTASHYAAYAYDVVGADAVTINPYMGFDAVRPFLRDGKCVFVLCLTSNASAAEFQMLEADGAPLFEAVARRAVLWSEEGEVGLVVGATQPEHMQIIRNIVGDMPILVPGVGAQGGDVGRVVRECGGKAGSTIINSSRAILFASPGPDFPEAARRSCLELRDTINGHRRSE